MTPWTLHHGDCLDVLRGMETASVDAIVTDPPAGIAFMGKGWDGDKGGRRQWIAWLAEVMGECRRVAKPGGHALVWALPRTSHWTATAMEDAGWDVRDRLHHIQGAGFPKGTNISKAIDRAAGAEREVVGPGARHASRAFGAGTGDPALGSFAGGVPPATSPATPEAARWEGWNTALKPAAEDWWLCRAPLTEDTIAGNVLRWGTGAINVDGCRVATTIALPLIQSDPKNGKFAGVFREGSASAGETTTGRYPPNLLLSHHPDCREVGVREVRSRNPGNKSTAKQPGVCYGAPSRRMSVGYASPDGTETVPAWSCAPGCVVAALDAQSGITRSQGGSRGGSAPVVSDSNPAARPLCRKRPQRDIKPGLGDIGGASRYYPTFAWEADDFVPFLYCPKASRSERNAGCDGLPESEARNYGGGPLNQAKHECSDGAHRTGYRPPRANHHPTVKPVALLRWLSRLICPPGGLILDPFAGSGTGGVGALLEGFRWVGIEREEEYLPIIRARLAHAEQRAAKRGPEQVALFGGAA